MTEEGEASKVVFFGLVMLMKVFAKHKKKSGNALLYYYCGPGAWKAPAAGLGGL
jgi:hypothetical protein